MIQRTFTENIHLGSREVESALWDLDAVEQVDFLLAMIQRFERDFSNVCMELQYVKDEKCQVLTDIEQRKLKDVLEKIIEYLG